MSKLEEVARAIGSTIYGHVDPVDTPNTWGASMDAARAALSALRDPSIAMWEAFDDEMEFEAFSAFWNSAIDKAMER